jgi:HEAT repeat protein
VPLDEAADAIHQIRDWPVSLLQPCLSDPSEPTRALAVELVGRFHDLESVDILLGVLSDDSSTGVRVRAARALGRIGSPRSVEGLMACVHVGPPDLRAESIAALGRMGAAAAVPSLKVALLGSSLVLSQAAAAALSAITPKGVAVLEEIAIDHSHPAAAVARRALDVALVPEPSLPW